VLIYQSRVFTEQGGNIELFSANGDLNAGRAEELGRLSAIAVDLRRRWLLPRQSLGLGHWRRRAGTLTEEQTEQLKEENRRLTGR
jgi:hypothetical protein